MIDAHSIVVDLNEQKKANTKKNSKCLTSRTSIDVSIARVRTIPTTSTISNLNSMPRRRLC